MISNQNSQNRNERFRKKIRIIWAIVTKDLVEALKNKNTIAIILITLLMTVFYYYLPRLSARDEPPRVRIYDAGESSLVPLMEDSDSLNVRTYPSQEIVIEALRNNDVPTLGLFIPEDFDQLLEADQEIALQGYVLSWVSRTDADELRQAIESEVAGLLGIPVPILLDSNQFSLAPESHGIGTTAAIAILFTVVMIGLTMIPHLMLEEKKTHTMEVLLVSPASAGDLVAGKAIVGLFYCLLGAAISLVIFKFVVIHWWLAILTVVLGALFTVSLGLWLGSIIESRAQLTMWAWVFILPLLLPVFLSLMEELLPDTLIQVLQYIPTAVMLNLLRTSYSAVIPLGKTLFQLAWLAAWAGGFLVFVTWLVHRQDRQPAGEATSRQFAEANGMPLLESGVRWLGTSFKRLSPAEVRQTESKAAISPESKGDKAIKNSPLNIIWTIAAKDISGMLKNRLVLSIILGTVFVVASGSVPRMLIIRQSNPTAIVYDPGRSAILRNLTGRDEFQIGFVDSLAEMKEIVSEAPEVLLGFGIPQDFDHLAGDNETIILEAFSVHWADAEQVDQRATFFQEQLSQASGGQVQINVSEQRLYPPPVLEGQTIMFVMLVLIVILTMGFAMVPLLLVEEKTTHTLDVLLVSPAKIYQVAAGKALAGGFYCLLAVAVVLLLNRFLVVNWGVALLAVLLGITFAVMVGLLVGVISDNPTTVGMWGAILILGLFGLTMVGTFVDLNWLPIVQTLLDYLPTAAMAELLGFSLAGEFPVAQVWVNSAALLVAALIAFGLLAWRLRLTDR
jgi:ABC-2 type transport system permease protein